VLFYTVEDYLLGVRGQTVVKLVCVPGTYRFPKTWIVDYFSRSRNLLNQLEIENCVTTLLIQVSILGTYRCATFN
jgi:hypothetical protein